MLAGTATLSYEHAGKNEAQLKAEVAHLWIMPALQVGFDKF